MFRKSYTFEFKASVVEEASETSIRTVTEKYGLSERMVRRQKAEKISNEELFERNGKHKEGGGKKLIYLSMKNKFQIGYLIENPIIWLSSVLIAKNSPLQFGAFIITQRFRVPIQSLRLVINGLIILWKEIIFRLENQQLSSNLQMIYWFRDVLIIRNLSRINILTNTRSRV